MQWVFAVCLGLPNLSIKKQFNCILRNHRLAKHKHFLRILKILANYKLTYLLLKEGASASSYFQFNDLIVIPMLLL